jgi:protein TonB
MTMAYGFFPPEEQSPLRRWLIAGAVVLFVHAGLLAFMLWRAHQAAEGAPPEAVMLELEAVSTSEPSETQVETPLGPQMTESEPEVVEEADEMVVPELPTAPKPEAVLIHKPKPKKKVEKPKKPVVKPDLEKPAPRTSAPARSSASRASAGRTGAGGSSMSPSTWISQVHARIQAHHSHPGGGSGAARVGFSINRAGQILGVYLAGSSGSSVLDQAALATVRRSSPLPPPPPGIGGSLTIPVRFN